MEKSENNSLIQTICGINCTAGALRKGAVRDFRPTNRPSYHPLITAFELYIQHLTSHLRHLA